MAGPALALPQRGQPLPAVEVDDVSQRRMRPLPDRHPVLVIYEDKDAQKQNERARAVLGRINDRAANRARYEFVAVADVAAWEWWPARGHVLSDLQAISKRENTPLFADWKAALRKKWGLRPHQSVLVLADGNGKVLFAAEGKLSEAQLSALVAELAALGCDVS
jgi:predicted transcriptional regulator